MVGGIDVTREPSGEFIPSGLTAPLDEANWSHRETLQKRMKAWLKERPDRKQDDLYKLILDRYRDEQGDLKAELPIKESSLRAFLSRPKQQRLGNMMNVAYRALDKDGAWDPASRARDLVDHDPDHLFRSMHDYMRVPQLTSAALLRRLPGVYRIYRPIVTHPGCFVVGYLACRANPDSGVLSYREFNCIKRRHGREKKTLVLEGYAFKKSAMAYFVSSDSRRNSFHLTIMTNQEKNEDDRYDVLTGGFLDTIGNQAYSGRVIMERIPGTSPSDDVALESLEKEADMQTADELPPSILTFFRGDSIGDVTIF